jgi:putative ABC transport system substrate-binding protein
MMRHHAATRREWLALLAGAALASAEIAAAQTARRTRRIGVLLPYPASDAEVRKRVAAFRQELGRLGWREGESAEFSERWATDDLGRIRAEAADLVRWPADIIVTTGSRVVPIVQRETRSIPIVFAAISDPVGQGLVTSLARPGGNTTGFSLLEFSGDSSPIIGKMIELLKEIAPGIARVAMIYNPENPASVFHARALRPAAAALALDSLLGPAHRPAEIERVIASVANPPKCGLLFPSDLTILAHRERVVELAQRYRIPAIYSDRAFTAQGGLISYSADRTDMFRRAASYVDRILRGEKPADLPVQQPTRYELTVNVRTALELGLTVPPAILVRADEVIE